MYAQYAGVACFATFVCICMHVARDTHAMSFSTAHMTLKLAVQTTHLTWGMHVSYLTVSKLNCLRCLHFLDASIYAYDHSCAYTCMRKVCTHVCRQTCKQVRVRCEISCHIASYRFAIRRTATNHNELAWHGIALHRIVLCCVVSCCIASLRAAQVRA